MLLDLFALSLNVVEIRPRVCVFSKEMVPIALVNVQVKLFSWELLETFRTVCRFVT